VTVGNNSYPVESAVEPVESAVEPVAMELVESAIEPVVVLVQPAILIMESVPVVESAQDNESETRVQWELRVYTRRKEPIELLIPRPLSLPALTSETHSSSTTDPYYSNDMIHLSISLTPFLVRWTTRSNTKIPPDRYGFYPDHDITHYVSYSHISPSHGAFITSLNIVSFLKCWQDIRENHK
jgi:hypothetical protein